MLTSRARCGYSQPSATRFVLLLGFLDQSHGYLFHNEKQSRVLKELSLSMYLVSSLRIQ